MEWMTDWGRTMTSIPLGAAVEQEAPLMSRASLVDEREGREVTTGPMSQVGCLRGGT